MPELVFCIFSETPQGITLFTRSYSEALSQAYDHIHKSTRADQTKRICNLKIYEDVVTGVEQQDQFTFLLMVQMQA